MPLLHPVNNGRRPPSASPSILDSPTLARVERARKRNENEEQGNSPFHSTLSSYCPSMVSVEPGRETHAIKKGLLWQQRERLFARWKERYFILTRDYLHCFKRSSGSEKISNMGQFIFKVKLVEVEKVEWINKKSYSTVALVIQDRDYRILLRTNEGLEDWFELLEECTAGSKERRRALHRFASPNLWAPKLAASNATEADKEEKNRSNLDTWLLSRTNPASLRLEPRSSLSDSYPNLQADPEEKTRKNQPQPSWRKRLPVPLQQRLSLLTDIDLNSYESSSGPSSMYSAGQGTVYREVVFVSSEEKRSNNTYINSGPRSSFSPLSSFRHASSFTPPRETADSRHRYEESSVQIKYRDRSQSDALSGKARYSSSNRRSYVSQQPAAV